MNIVIKWTINPNDLCSTIPDVLGYQSMMTSLMSTYMMIIWWSKARSMWSNKPQVFAPDDIRDVLSSHPSLYWQAWVLSPSLIWVESPWPTTIWTQTFRGSGWTQLGNWDHYFCFFSYNSRLIPFDCSSSYQLTLIIDDYSIHWTSSSPS